MHFPQSQVAAALCHGIHATARSTTTLGPLAIRRHSLFHHATTATAAAAAAAAALRLGPHQRAFLSSSVRLYRDTSSSSNELASSSSSPLGESKSEHAQTQPQPQQHQQQQYGNHKKRSKPSTNGSGSSGSATKKKLRDPLRRVASLAQRSSGKPPSATRDGQGEPGKDYSSTICAICVAESFNMKTVARLLQDQHYLIDPDGLDFDNEEVVHVGVRGGPGDFFIFETGTVVTWSLPPEKGIELATGLLTSAHENSHMQQMDRDEMTEKLEFETDPTTSLNSMRGDTVVLGTKRNDEGPGDLHAFTTDIGRAKIAFSSGLARSTKVAVLETLLNSYLERTEELPAQLESGRLRVDMKAILQRTGELLRLRSQLNFFSELTDSLPDKFWDQRAELKLDGIYDQVGKALDVPSRIRVLNQRMDYADSMLETFREMLHSTHSARLEWIIIVLITIEVGFELFHLWREFCITPTTATEGQEQSKVATS